MKRVFAVMCAVLVMVCAVVPCFAWGDMGSPDNYGLPVTGAPVYANYEANTDKVIEVVNKAVALDKFGGMPVLAVMYYFVGDSYVIVAICPASTTSGYIISSARDETKKGTIQWGAISGTQQQFAFNPNSNQQRSPFVTFVLQHGGDWLCSGYYSATQYITTSTASVTSGQTMWKKVAYWSANANGVVKSVNSTSTAGQGLSTGEYMPGLDTILSVYDAALEKMNAEPEPPSEPAYSYQLNIASIFDGYFGGVRDVLGAFDINLFGINIIGVLIAFIVIAVVAFIVRKLWK